MKKLFLAMAVALMAIGLTSCGPDLDTPEDTVNSYMKAYLDMDAENMVKCLGDEDGEELSDKKAERKIKDIEDYFDDLSKKDKEEMSKAEFKIFDTDEDKNSAKVLVDITVDGDSHTIKVYLKKGSDDKWRITNANF